MSAYLPENWLEMFLDAFFFTTGVLTAASALFIWARGKWRGPSQPAPDA